MRRYIVNFKGNGHIIFHSEDTNWHSITISLSAENLGHSCNNFFTDGETKAFELAVDLSVSASGEDEGEVAGNSYFNLGYAITVHNGEVDVQVKPFKFDPYNLDWEIYEYDGNGSEDCAEILSEECLDIDIDWNFTASGIKQFLSKLIIVEPIED